MMKLPSYVAWALSALFVSSSSWALLPSADGSGNTLPSLAPMLKSVNSAVVNVATYSKQSANNPLLNDPFFRQFFNEQQLQQQQQRNSKPQPRGAGSGVIVDAGKGTIITNYHVIHGADEIRVVLNDGRSFPAKLIGSDSEVDIAVLKIEAEKLTALNPANSDNLEVGDFVVAIGNPFGLGQTVTSGIVSALGRTGLGIEGYEDFIQTDASINPGNSGGALVNLRGELVGINTAIIAPAGGSVGIGFAIPINMVNGSVAQILEKGQVVRGQIGVSIQDVTPDLQEAFNLENGQLGVLVTGVAEKSEAESAGIKPGDVIVDVEGKDTLTTDALRNAVGKKKIGDSVKITLIREGKRKTVTSRVGDSQTSFSATGKLHDKLAGARFENNPDGGVIVAAIDPNSHASTTGISVGDVILGANRVPVNNIKEFGQALQKSSETILLHIQRGGGRFYLVIR